MAKSPSKSRKKRANADTGSPEQGNVEKVKGFYIIEKGDKSPEQERPRKRLNSEGESQGESPLMRLRHRAFAAHPDMRNGLAEVAKKHGWQATLGGVDDRLDRLSQVLLSGERSMPLKRRFLLLTATLLGLYALMLRSTLQQQVQSWVNDPGSTIGLTGIDGSVVVPLLFTFWYMVTCVGLNGIMESIPPLESFVFELTVTYNVLQAGMNAYVALAMMQEAQALGFKFVGNAVGHSASDHRIGIIAILHYHLKILELVDTFILILRKKLYRESLHLHWALRILNLWSWHVACRVGCGGDIYFPVVTNAICSTLLHMHYVFTLIEPHAAPLQWMPLRRFLPEGQSLIGLRRSIVQVVQVVSFQLCLLYGILSLYSGSYPKLVLVFNIGQCCFGLLLHCDFHYLSKLKGSQPDAGDDAHEAKLAFSFDSSGWCYFYHFGVAMWIQEHFTEEISKGELAFSGSSGGAIVGCALATNIDIPTVLQSNIDRTWPTCRRNPQKLPEEVQWTLETFCPKDGYLLATNRLRVLMTRVVSTPPFLMGEVATKFRSNEHLFDVLQASSCIPVLNKPKVVDGGRYIDGLFWMSALVPWRSFKSQNVCRVSCMSTFGSDIGPRWNAIPPFWWAFLPPSREALEGLCWAGYRDIAAAFGSTDGPKYSGCSSCSRRQSNPTPTLPPRLKESSLETIDELIGVYEFTARRDWSVFLGFFFVVTITLTLTWLSSLVV